MRTQRNGFPGGESAFRHLRRRLAAALLLCLAGGMLAPMSIAREKPAKPISGLSFRRAPAGPAGELVRSVNAFRAAHGLPALSWNAKLAAAAGGFARDLDASRTFGHVGSKGSVFTGRMRAVGYSLCAGAENVARSFPSAAGVVDGWSNSPGHRANMLGTRVNEAGAGYSNLNGRPIWVLDLGKRC